ncbi:DUF6792 domain-containing protein [Priestia koreensis]|uniref:DUF6792 domain-containing protein n=2 Tax=Bacteria TaxID=2 RepID=UPI003017A1CA
MENEVLFSKELRFRITNLDYSNLSDKKFEAEVRRIYFEETGKKLDAKISVLNSKNVDKVNNKIPSSYDGRSIHFYDPNIGLNQLYIVSQGTTDKKDWTYNLKAIFAGEDISQARNADIFTDYAKAHSQKNINKSIKNLEVIALGHSLGHNNNSVAYLLYHSFDKVYGVNGAQASCYELYKFDNAFAEKVNEKFGITGANRSKQVYKLPPESLKAFTSSYYDAQNIHQDISNMDPLNAGSDLRGFVPLGDINFIDTDPNHPGIKSLIDKIPDKDVVDLQKIAIEYAEMSEKKVSTNEMIQKLTGIDMSVVSKFQEDSSILGIGKTYASKNNEIDEMIANVNKKFPPLLNKVKKLTSSSDIIYEELYKGNYITAEQKNIAMKETKNIQEILKDMEKEIASMQNARDYVEEQYNNPQASANMTNPGAYIVGTDASAGYALYKDGQKLAKSFKKLSTALGPAMDTIIDGHSINQMLNAIGKEQNKAYTGQDMILMSGKRQEIKVNVSAAVRMYQEGHAVLTEKQGLITQYSNAFHEEVTADYSHQKQKVSTAINDIEDHPNAHIDLLNKHIFSIGKNVQVESAQVHDSLKPLTDVDISHIIEALTKTVTESNQFLETTRSGIEKLFAKDHDVSMLFDYYPGGK